MKNLLPKNGEVFFYPDFFSAKESRDYLNVLQKKIKWKHEAISLFGKKILQPRLTAWMSDEGISYKYSGLQMQGQVWDERVLEIKNKIESLKKSYKFNSVLLNFYRDGQDSMGWHKDDEKELGKNPLIASVSFGGARNFQFRHIDDSKLKVSLPLTDGSLLIMSGATQHYWQHAVPKSKVHNEPRVNLTFRFVKS